MWLFLAGLTVVSSAAVWLPVGMSRIYENFDGPYYIAVAKSWYDRDFLARTFSFPIPLEYYPAHFPGFPLLINIFAAVVGNRLIAMVTASVLFAAGGAILMYEIAKSHHLPLPAWIAGAWLFFWPRMWAVRSVGSPETVFIFLVMASVWCFEKKKYWLAAMWGVLATLTKSPGIILLLGYGLWAAEKWLREKQVEWKAAPVALIGVTILGIFYFFKIRTGDFWAYFHSGDNIHLQAMPFKIFDAGQAWVGSFWLEDVLWIYLVAGYGIISSFAKSRVWGWWGVAFFTSLIFVSHRDISRYSLPLVPGILLGLSPLLARREMRVVLALLLIPMYFYTINFLRFNFAAIADWTPFL